MSERKDKQFVFPGFERYKIDIKRTKPKPNNVSDYQPTSEYASLLAKTPLNLQNRGRIQNWIFETERRNNFIISEVLPNNYNDLFQIYFDLSEIDEWPNQEFVSAQITGEEKTSWIGPTVYWGMSRIWRRAIVGAEAIEIMKPDHYFYRHMVNLGVWTVSDLYGLRDDVLALTVISKHRSGFQEIDSFMKERFSDWHPEISFLNELAPNEAEELHKVLTLKRESMIELARERFADS